jgi:hypothetical protein
MRILAAQSGSRARGVTLVALLVLGCAATPLSAQQVYKSVDAEGHVVYSDRGGSKSAPKTTLHVDEPDPAEAARLAHEQDLLKADDATRSRQQALEDKTKTTQQHKKQVACENARNQYYHMREAARLYKRDDSGNREYYSDDEADAMREQARQAMVAACGS